MKAKSQITKLALACLIGAASPFIPSMRKNKHQETRARNKVAEAEAITKAEAAPSAVPATEEPKAIEHQAA